VLECFRFQVFKINVSVLITVDHYDFHAAHRRGGRVGALKRDEENDGRWKDRMEIGKEERRVAQDSIEKVNYGSIAEKVVRRKVQNE
jgi:hypothetical protein